nr:pentatricopeptide repeat protein AaPPR1402 [Agave angustifolia]
MTPNARQLFDEIPDPDASLYNTIIRAYSLHNSPDSAISLYLQMLTNGSPPNDHTFPCLLKSFDRPTAVALGDEVHAHAIKFGLCDNQYVQNSLIRMYGLTGETDTARELFERSEKGNAVMWNTTISAYNRSKQFVEACELFREMQRVNVRPTLVTLISVLSACAKLKDLDFGAWVHGIVGDWRMIPSLKLRNALIEMYAGCGDMVTAWRMFEGMEERDVITWTSIVTGFANSGQLDRARTLFDQMPERDIVSWTAMIDGYVRSSRFKEALELFRALQKTGVCPDEFTVVSVLTACAQLGALELGEWIRVYMERKRIKMDTHVGNALIDMYSKCGCVDSALEIFQKVPRRDKFTWTAIIVGLAINGNGDHSLRLFSDMLRASIRPDEITFIGVLSACTHSGLVDEGREFFSKMITTYGITPSVTHYGCLVDLLSRAGRLQEALETINNMPMKPNSTVWGSLLGACRVYKNVEMAELACYRLLALDPENGATYVMLSNIYAKCHKWDEVRRVREMMMDRGIKKEPGCSLIEMSGKVHEFVAGDRSHARSDDVYSKLEEIGRELKLAGYVADTSEVLLDIREEEKESAVYQHSEKLALAFGLLSSEPGATIRIVKNLRMCLDCHSAMSLVSRLYLREIIVRDRTRFHHFRDGSCSCKDFW